jgi:branched-chain amino acid transport system substrate-binding protein
VNDHEIKVGLSVSLSGRFQLQGQHALEGILLWQRCVNAQGGIPVGSVSRSIRLIWYDDEGRVTRTRENVLRLVRDDGIDILLGPYSSNLTMTAAEIAEAHKKLLWNYGGASDEIFGRGWQSIIGISSPASDYFRTLPHWLAKNDPELRQICVLYSANGSFGRQINRGVVESARETGHSVHSVPLQNSDAVLSAILSITPEAVVLASSFQDELVTMRTRPRWPTTVRAVAAVAAGVLVFASELEQTADGVIGPSQWEPTVSFPEVVGPTSDWFTDSFKKRFGIAPDYVAAASFATGVILAECIRRAGSLDDDELRNIVFNLDCNTLYGCFRVDGKNGKQIGHQILLIRWQNDQKVMLPSPFIQSRFSQLIDP